VRTPMLKKGDVLLFDYAVLHRGGANLSPDSRPILYYTLSTRWFRDDNFLGKETQASKYDQMMHSARYAMSPSKRRAAEAQQTAAAREQIDAFFQEQVWGGKLSPETGFHSTAADANQKHANQNKDDL
jgi:hypothetical protein